MPLEERAIPLSPELREIASDNESSDGIAVLPESVTEIDGNLVAGFRPDMQAIGVLAAEAGVAVELLLPDGAEPGLYSEHDADWVLPLFLELSNGVTAGLIANYLQRLYDEWRGRNSGMPTVRHREVISAPDGTEVVRELEGPAPEIIEWLRDRERDGR